MDKVIYTCQRYVYREARSVDVGYRVLISENGSGRLVLFDNATGATLPPVSVAVTSATRSAEGLSSRNLKEWSLDLKEWQDRADELATKYLAYLAEQKKKEEESKT